MSLNWEKILRSSHGLSKVFRCRHSIPLSPEMLLLSIRSLRFECREQIRVYDENKGSRADLRVKVIENPIHPFETVKDWSTRIFEGKRFGIVLNHLEDLDDEITQIVMKELKGYFDPSGIPHGGVQIAFFAGNYGFTPFGIHHDPNRLGIFHFHLGPGKKKIHVWEKPDLPQDFKYAFDPVPYLSTATTTELKPGDFFVLPTSGYHIGESQELSVGLAISLSSDPATEEMALSQHLKKTKVFKDFKTKNASDYQTSRKSNLGLPPTPVKEVKLEDFPKRVALVGPFPLLWKKDQKNLILYSRGHRMKIQSSVELIRVLEKLSTHHPQESRKLFHELIQTWGEKPTLKWVESLLSKQVLRVSPQ